MSTPDETMLTATCGVCDDVLVRVPTPCASVGRGPSAALFVCATCGTRQVHPRRRDGDYFDVVMQARSMPVRSMTRHVRMHRMAALSGPAR